MLRDIEYATGVLNKIRVVNTVYEYLVDNRWFIDVDCFDTFVNVAESKLIETMVTYPEEYAHYGLYFMQQLFGIELQVRVDVDTGELLEYITNRAGDVITW